MPRLVVAPDKINAQAVNPPYPLPSDGLTLDKFALGMGLPGEIHSDGVVRMPEC